MGFIFLPPPDYLEVFRKYTATEKVADNIQSELNFFYISQIFFLLACIT